MNAQDLKNSILQLAIKGKLVEQREEEGTADTLFKKIEMKKNNLIKDMKVRGQKVVPQIHADEIPFDIPETWKWVRLSQLGVIIGGGTPKTSINEYWNKGTIPWITPADMKNVEGKCVSGGSRYITQMGLDKSSAKLMPKGTIVYSSRAPIGYIAIADNKISTNQGFKSLVPAIEDINMYFYYCLISRTNEIQSRASGTTFKEISGTEFAKTVVPLPPLEEQKRIVAKIEELMPFIERHGDAYEEVTELNKKFPLEMEKSILQYAIQGKLVKQKEEEGTAEELYHQIQEEKQKLIDEGTIKKQKKLPEITEEEIPFDIPDTWKWVRLDQIGQTNIGLTYKPKDVSDNGTIVLRSGNIQNGVLDYKDIVKVSSDVPVNKMCEIGDILICARNGSKRLVGKAAIIDKEGMSFGAFMTKYRSLSLSNEYLLYVINSPYFRSTMLPDAGTTTINQITQGRLRNLPIPLPPLEEQRRIVVKIEELLDYTKKLVKED